jgi:DNA-binding MarR family transcriptional regulator
MEAANRARCCQARATETDAPLFALGVHHQAPTMSSFVFASFMRAEQMPTTPPITLIAFKAMCLCENLNRTERRVLAALLEHYNRRTARCDPSVTRIAALLQVNQRTVFRALKALVAKGYVIRVRHGGYSHRNKYVPRWEFYLQIIEEWRRRWQSLSRTQGMTESSGSQRQSCHRGDGNPVTQTSSNKPFEQTLSTVRQEKPVLVRELKAHEKETQQPRIERAESPRCVTPASRDAARDAAERRWNIELQKTLGGDERLTALAVDMMTPELMAAATAAEFAERGSGSALVLSHLSRVASSGGAQ